MISPSAVAAVLALAVPAASETPCHDLVEGVQYCSDARVGPTFISEVIYPDILFNFIVQADPQVTSKVIAMPIDRAITSWADVQDMVFDQVMFRGSARFHSIGNMSGSPSFIDGENSARLEYIGYNANDGIMAVSVVDATPLVNHVLIIITSSERLDQVTPDLRALHQQSVDSVTGVMP
ncbi:MAG: hypothetical protein AAF376_07905 [Pseudomonadota bacterium]